MNYSAVRWYALQLFGLVWGLGLAQASWYPEAWSALSLDNASLSTEQQLQAIEKLQWYDPEQIAESLEKFPLPPSSKPEWELQRDMISLIHQSLLDGLDVAQAKWNTLLERSDHLDKAAFWRGRLHILLGDLHFRRGNPLQAIHSYELADLNFKLARELEWRFLAQLRSGRLRALVGEHQAVVESLQPLIERSNDFPNIQASGRLLLAWSSKILGRPDYKTQRFLGREVLLMSGDPTLYSLVLVSDFDFLMMDEDWIVAEETILETRMFNRVHGMKWLQARKFALRAQLDLVYNQIESSAENLDQALHLIRESGWSGWQGLMLISYANHALNYSQPALAKERFQQALPLNTQEMRLIIEPEIYGGLSLVAELQGDFSSAYEAHRRYKEAADQRLHYIVRQHQQMLEQRIEMERRQLDAALEETQIWQNRRIRNLLIMGLLLLLIAVVLLAIRLRLAAIANAHLEKAVANEKIALENANTARRAAEQANMMKSEFISNISHEVRTPLNAVIGMASLLEELNLSAQQQQCVDTIKVCGDHLMRLISDILDLGSIEAGRLELYEENVAIEDIIRHCMMMLESKARTKGLPIELQCADNLPAVIVGDKLRLGQVLINLMDNAIKFTAKGSVVLKVSVSPITEATPHLIFEVIDSGIGIAADQLDRIFEPFTQVDSSPTRSHTGAGLGLTISKRLVQLMGGQISVQSEIGKGTTFRVRIPTSKNQIQP